MTLKGEPNNDQVAINDRVAIEDRAIEDRAIEDRAIEDRAIDEEISLKILNKTIQILTRNGSVSIQAIQAAVYEAISPGLTVTGLQQWSPANKRWMKT
jgi:hypothetical protein